MTRKNNYTIVCLVFCVLSFFIISCNKKASNSKIILISAISEDVYTMLLELSADSLIGFKVPCFLKNGQAFNDLVMTRTPAARWGESEDVGNAALFLVSKAANFINGHLLYVDGGILANFGYVKGENEVCTYYRIA